MAKKFTSNAQKIILIAQEEAKRLNHDYVGTEHILLGLSAIEGTVSNKILSIGIYSTASRSFFALENVTTPPIPKL